MAIIPRNSNGANNSNAADKHAFNAQLAAVCTLTAEESEAIKANPTAVPTAFRQAVAGDVLLLSVDKDGYYKTPRLRVDNEFKKNPAFANVPKFTLVDLLTNGTNDEGELDAVKATAFAATKIEEYKKQKQSGKAAILALLTKKA